MEQYIYAQLDKSDICVGVSYLSGKVIKDDLMHIDIETAALCLGKKYNNGVWEEMPKEPEPEPETQATNNKLLAKLKEQEQEGLNRDELLLEQQLLLLDMSLNIGV